MDLNIFDINFASDKLATDTIVDSFMAIGHFEPFMLKVTKFGRNSEIDTSQFASNGFVDVWNGGTSTNRSGGSGHYTGFDLETPQRLLIYSDSPNDTAAGTGARTVFIAGLDANYQPITEIVTTNGIAGTLTTNSYIRQNRGKVTSAGSSNTNEGQIFAVPQGKTFPTECTMVMPARRGQSQICAYTIPADYTGVVIAHYRRAERAGAARIADSDLMVRNFGTNVFNSKKPATISSDGNGFDVLGGAFETVPAKADIVTRVFSVTANDLGVSAGFDILMFPTSIINNIRTD